MISVGLVGVGSDAFYFFVSWVWLDPMFSASIVVSYQANSDLGEFHTFCSSTVAEYNNNIDKYSFPRVILYLSDTET